MDGRIAAVSVADMSLRHLGSWLLTLLLLLGAAPARALSAVDPEDLARPSGPGSLTVGGRPITEMDRADRRVPAWASATLTLAIAAGGFVLAVPQLSVEHVLGVKPGANRRNLYLGLGLLALAPPVGLFLSGAGLGTTAVAPVIEVGLQALAFGLAYVADRTLQNGKTSELQQLLVGQLAGYSLLGVAIVAIAAAALFPVFTAFVSGAELELEDARPAGVIVGAAPTAGGGGELLVAFRF